MKQRLSELLRCPCDGGELELTIWESRRTDLSDVVRAKLEQLAIDPRSVEQEVISGVLVNHRRKLLYPIYQGVPRLLSFHSGVAETFAQENSARLRSEFAGYSLPSSEPMPGEQDVLRTFSSEWVNYDWDGQSYWDLSPDAWFRAMRFILNLEEQPVHGKLVLEVGIGVGGVADFVSRDQQCEMVGMDLGYSVDVAYKHFGDNPFLHIVQGSAFAAPFAPQTFDFVYSWGVLHHTFSTKTAVERVSKLPKSGGRLFVWVYSPHDENRTVVRRGVMLLERILRPCMWRLPEGLQAVALAPVLPLYLVYHYWHSLGNRDHVRYGLREAMHAARDRFTPRYIHRHTDEEMCGWFRELGFQQLSCSSQRKRPEYVPIPFTACTGVSGIKCSHSAASTPTATVVQ